MLPIRLINSSRAGWGKPWKSLGPDILPLLKKQGIDLVTTENAQDVGRLAREWADRYGQEGLVYIFGGDGSVNETAQALYKSQCAMGVLPGGTGNDFAHYLYQKELKKEEILALLADLRHPQLRPIDLFSVNGRIGVNTFSLGEDTMVLQKAYAFKDKHPSLGRFSYYVGAARHLLDTHLKLNAYPMRFRLYGLEGEEMVLNQAMVLTAVANGQYFGGGYRPSPTASIEDGLLDLVFASPVTVRQLLRLLPDFRKGKHLGDPIFHFARIPKIEIEAQDGRLFPANVDGILLEARKYTLEILPKAQVFAFLGQGQA